MYSHAYYTHIHFIYINTLSYYLRATPRADVSCQSSDSHLEPCCEAQIPSRRRVGATWGTQGMADLHGKHVDFAGKKWDLTKEKHGVSTVKAIY